MEKCFVICISMVLLFRMGLASVCPQPKLIAPCTCNDQFNKIDCNNVTSDRILGQVFTRLRSELDKIHAKPLFDELRLSYSSLNEIASEQDIFAGVAFRHITISYNSQLKRINADAFVASFNVTRELFIEDNELLGASISDGKALFEMINQFSELQTLRLSDSGIRFIPNKAFARSQFALSKIYLTDNPIEEVGEHAFSGLAAIANINLDGNQIHRLATSAFDIGASVQKSRLNIYIRSNQLTVNSFPLGIFSRLKRQTYLNLDLNNITTLRQSVFQSFFHRGSILSVDKNPLSCDCDIKWLLDQDLFQLIKNFQCTSSKDEEQIIYKVTHEDFGHCANQSNKEAIRVCIDQARSAEQEDQCFNRANTSHPWFALILSNMLIYIVYRICYHEF